MAYFCELILKASLRTTDGVLTNPFSSIQLLFILEKCTFSGDETSLLSANTVEAFNKSAEQTYKDEGFGCTDSKKL